MTKLLNDVLIIGKADAGKLDFNPAPLELENFCFNLLEELQLNDTNQHQLVFTIDEQGSRESGVSNRKVGDSLLPTPHSPLPTKLPCLDEKLLRQILENLLSNAIKYSPSGNTIKFTLSRFPNRVVFQIQDQGMGIPREDQEQLFDTFHRASNVGTISGTGLGLAIVKRCVDIHQGQIAMESEVGVGTTFTVTLPTYN